MTRTTVSKAFRERLLADLPGLSRNPAYWRLLGWVLFGRLTEAGGVLVTREILAKLEGKEHQLKNRNYSGIKLLEAFRRDVLPRMEWSKFEYSDGKAREITEFGLPDKLMLVLLQERETPVHKLKERVYLDSGLKWTSAGRRRQREEDRASAMVRLDNAGCREARALMKYLNNLPGNRFAKMLKHLPEAYAAAARLENKRSRERAFRLLRNIADQPQPVYGPTEKGRTVRLFSTNESLCRLPRQVRKVLTKDWTSVDLKSAQLAIVGHLWGVPLVEEFLRTGASVWEHMCQELDVRFTEENKKGIKQMVYALVFGAGQRKNQPIDKVAQEYFPNEADFVRRFISVPLIAAVYQGRKAAEAQVRQANGTYDAFGNWIALQENDQCVRPARSVLASQAQSYELKLLLPVIEEAMRNDEFDVTVYLFDGLCLAFKDATKQNAIIERLKGKVAAVAEQLQMPTELEVEVAGVDQPSGWSYALGPLRQKRPETSVHINCIPPYPTARPVSPVSGRSVNPPPYAARPRNIPLPRGIFKS